MADKSHDRFRGWREGDGGRLAPLYTMKLTIFGLTISSSWGNGHATPYRALVRALARAGHHVVFYEQDTEFYRLRRDFWVSDHFALVIYQRWEDIRDHALANAGDSDAVMVASFCPRGAEIADDVLALHRPIRVFYDLDTPVTLRRLASESPPDYLRADQVPQYDLYLSWTGGRTLDQLEQRWGARRALPLYGCVDPDTYQRVPPRPGFQCDLSYMGTYAADRQQKLDDLLLEPSRRTADNDNDTGDHPKRRFVVAGTLYPWHWQWGANVVRFDHIAPADHAAFYSSSRATLNITREDMASAGYCPSGRFFEAAACGTPILSDEWEGLSDFFEPERELIVVRTADDTLQALAMEDRDLAAIAARARQRTLDQHTGAVRARTLLQYLGSARSASPAASGKTFVEVKS